MDILMTFVRVLVKSYTKLWPPIYSPPAYALAPPSLPVFITLYQKLNCLFSDLFYLLVNRWFNSTKFLGNL